MSKKRATFLQPLVSIGGGLRIRTLGGDKPSTVFKTAAFDHSASPPETCLLLPRFAGRRDYTVMKLDTRGRAPLVVRLHSQACPAACCAGSSAAGRGDHCWHAGRRCHWVHRRRHARCNRAGWPVAISTSPRAVLDSGVVDSAAIGGDAVGRLRLLHFRVSQPTGAFGCFGCLERSGCWRLSCSRLVLSGLRRPVFAGAA